MHLHITTILFIIFEHINKIFTQGIPISPCPKMFQYRFDGAEWFGILSVRNPDFGQALHLRVILSMRGKPTTNYLGEIELLTRGQFLSEAPVLYKIKFPKNHFPPKLLQITTNNHVVCLGSADHSIFVTQIQLEHTRKFTFLSEEQQQQQQAPPIQSSSSSSLLPSTAASIATATTVGGGGAVGSGSGTNAAAAISSSISMLPITTGLKDSSLVPPTNIAFGTKHLPLTSSMDKNPLRISKDICGTIDDRIRFQVMKALKQKSATTTILNSAEAGADAATRQPFRNPLDNIRSILSALLQRQDDIDEIPAVGQRNEVDSGGGGGGDDGRGRDTDESNDNEAGEDDDIDLPPLVTTDIDGETDFFADDESASDTGSLTINELPSITRGAWPWLAAVYVNNLTSLAYQCGGTLISTRIVVSAAHCFQLFKKRYTANEVLVFLGRHNLKNWNEEGSVAAPVDDIFIHPDYNQHLSSYDADIAVVVLKNEVRYNTFIRPACMWTGSTSIEFIEGEPGIVVGWGLGSFNTTKQMSTTSTVPKIISTPVVSNEVCFAANPKYKSLTSNRTFCAGIMYDQMLYTKSLASKPLVFNKQLHQGPCTGDSGAGLMIFRNNRWVLRGTVSGSLPMFEMQTKRTQSRAATRSCSINQYVVYTDVAKFLDWIFAFVL
ncbi:serine protease gd [Musca vetustissima]|uniref:serine protease gd n=1 Tax=Musca vetustissima TaxID=27455 RepID=UPI002AB6749D|nr:serine protease gd [Musca vetustissima]